MPAIEAPRHRTVLCDLSEGLLQLHGFLQQNGAPAIDDDPAPVFLPPLLSALGPEAENIDRQIEQTEGIRFDRQNLGIGRLGGIPDSAHLVEPQKASLLQRQVGPADLLSAGELIRAR